MERINIKIKKYKTNILPYYSYLEKEGYQITVQYKENDIEVTYYKPYFDFDLDKLKEVYDDDPIYKYNELKYIK